MPKTQYSTHKNESCSGMSVCNLAKPMKVRNRQNTFPIMLKGK